MAGSRWVFPNPESPGMNRGLYAFAGASATATAAACAKRLLEPITNVSNVYLGLSRAWVGRGAPGPAPAGLPAFECSRIPTGLYGAPRSKAEIVLSCAPPAWAGTSPVLVPVPLAAPAE